MNRVCKDCGEPKPLSAFEARRRVCRQCALSPSAARREAARVKSAKWRESNPKAAAEYHCRNRAQILERQARYRQDNKETRKALADRWYAENGRAYYASRRATPRGKLDHSMSAGICASLTGSKKSRRAWETLVGYSLDDLIAHLERQFLPGMNWANYGRDGWHVDHKVPKVAFNYRTPEDIDFKRCWALSNLQPLWQRDNLTKQDKLSEPFQPSFAFG